MKALIKNKTTRTDIKPLQSRLMKKTLHTEFRKIVPIFAARYRSISETLHQLRQVENPNEMRK
jgi:hypothetical protein